MKAGRDLDALVAEKVMGENNLRGVEPHPVTGKIYPMFQYRPYSTDIAAAWDVVEKLRGYTEHQHSLQFDLTARTYTGGYFEGDFKAKFSFGGGAYIAFAETAPHAICLAALKAKGVEV